MKWLPWSKPRTLVVEARWIVILQGPLVPEGREKRCSALETSEYPRGTAWVRVMLLPSPGLRDPLYQGTSWGEGRRDAKSCEIIALNSCLLD